MSLTHSALAQFTGTELWFKHRLIPSITYTEGVKYLADEGNAYWLLDMIALSQNSFGVKREAFQIWKLSVKEDHSAVLTCDDGNGNVIFTKHIQRTDFPLFEAVVWFTNDVMLLESEY